MRKWLLVLLTGFSLSLHAQVKDVKAILSLLETQSKEWNNGNLEGFMKGYWENDSLMFIGKTGITYGYQNTLSNYKKSYSDSARMGKLFFTILQVRRMSPEYYFVVGKWYLKRTVGDISGHFSLVFRKINGEWKIVADHSS